MSEKRRKSPERRHSRREDDLRHERRRRSSDDREDDKKYRSSRHVLDSEFKYKRRRDSGSESDMKSKSKHHDNRHDHDSEHRYKRTSDDEEDVKICNDDMCVEDSEEEEYEKFKKEKSEAIVFNDDDLFLKCSAAFRMPNNSNSQDIKKLASKENTDVATSSVPNSVIIVKGLQEHVTEDDLRLELLKYNPKSVQLVHGKDTGVSRGFAFVEFKSVNEATTFMEKRRGILLVKDICKASLHYSAQEDDKSKSPKKAAEKDNSLTHTNQNKKVGNFLNTKNYKDWFCVKCCTRNLKWRDICLTCYTSREESMLENDSDEVSAHPTKTILIRNLDVFTTEDSVLKVIACIDKSTPIRNIRISRDPDSEISLGNCYIDTNTVTEAKFLFDSLKKARPLIDGRKVLISYCKVSTASINPVTKDLTHAPIISDVVEQNSDSNKQISDLGNQLDFYNYSIKDIPQLAKYSASLYAKTPEEHISYIKYYTEFYMNKLRERNDTSSQEATISSAPKLHSTENNSLSSVEKVSSSNHSTYEPDISAYTFDESTGYYYDSQSGLYYDPSNKHYYNSRTDEFFIWNSEKHCLSKVHASNENKEENKTEKKEKVKDAKKVVKEMERWAKKGLKIKRSTPQSNTDGSVKSNKSADAGYSVFNLPLRSESPPCHPASSVSTMLEIDKDMDKWSKKDSKCKEGIPESIIDFSESNAISNKPHGSADTGYTLFNMLSYPDSPPRPTSSVPSILDIINKASSSITYTKAKSSDEDVATKDDSSYTDWDNFVCVLCKRKFQNKDALVRHQKWSDLHRSNLEAWNAQNKDQDNAKHSHRKYRDRATERRHKVGESTPPHPNRLKEKYLKARSETESLYFEEPNKEGIRSDNIGSKILHKMGWQEGKGLGKKNQGRVSHIEAEQRASGAGLGLKSTSYLQRPGESYKDCIKRRMIARYNDVIQREENKY